MKKLFLILLISLLPFALWAKQIALYHTSDTHGFFFPETDPKTEKQWGGFAAVKNVINKETLPYLLLDSGDFSNGTAEVKNTKGKAAAALMNATGYNATTIGNHEFDFGEDNFLSNIPLFKFPVLNANIYDSRADKPLAGTKPYALFNAGGVKTAVIGIGKEGDNKFFKFKKASSVIKNILPEVKKQNPGVIILLIHDSYGDEKHPQKTTNKDIAKKFPDINIILGGHAHLIFQNLYQGNTLLVESGANLKTMSKITVDVDDATGKYQKASSELITLYIDKAGQDQKIKDLAESVRVPGIDTAVGQTAELMSRLPVRADCPDTPLNNWIADIMHKNVPADIAVHNVGGARTDLEKGPVTLRDMISLFPFDNKVALVTVDGVFIKNLVRNSVKTGKSFYAYAGLTAEFEIKNKKVKNLSVFINGRPVENHKTYTLLTNEYIANGNTEGWMFKTVPAENKKFLNLSIREMLLKEIKENSPVKGADVCRLKKIK